MKKAVVKKKGHNDKSDNSSSATGERVSRKLWDNIVVAVIVIIKVSILFVLFH
jgi:preprotein translocase subunit SecF